MKKSLLALAGGAFVFGAAEFVMMGILTQAAHNLHISIPSAGNFITAYAVGVCVGTLILIIGRKAGPKQLLVVLMLIALAGNLMSFLAPSAGMLIAARFISGLPHGAFFGTATLVAKLLADKGKEAQAVSIMVTGQTVANMLGVPAGTLIAEHMSWRLPFLALAVLAACTALLMVMWLPHIDPVADTGLAGQFRFLTKPGPWFIIAATFAGNTGIFSWWSYVSPWLNHVGGYATQTVPWLMMLAGLGMVFGGLGGGRVADHWRHGGTAALGQMISVIGLAWIAFIPGSRVVTAMLTFVVAFAMFFIASPQQLLMAEAGAGGGELIGGAAVQIAFNMGNALGSALGGFMLSSAHMDYHAPALGGIAPAAIAVLMLAIYTWRYETHTDALERMQPVEV